MKHNYIKSFNDFKILNESMGSIVPEMEYAKYNLEVDGIPPMSVTSDSDSIKSVYNRNRRVAWVNLEKMFKVADEFDVIKMYDLNDPGSVSGKVGHEKIKELSGYGNWGNYAYPYVNKEYLLYNGKYEKQAIAAHKEFLKRGGWWYETNPVDDIYLARLMGYGEEYIVPFIRKYFPDFDVDTYIKENPRKEALDFN